MDTVKGSIETLNSFQLTEDMRGLDAQSKLLLHSKEVLSVILQGTVREYKGYSKKEIMGFIEVDSISEDTEVSPGRTNTAITGDSAEYKLLNEKVTQFDIDFRALNPMLTKSRITVKLHIDIEPQKDYSLPYPVEKRGMYYLARKLSSQLSLVTEQTDYGQLEKCYSIWICRDNIPKNEQYSVSVYETVNTQNTSLKEAPKENYDLMTLVVIKLGNIVYNGEKGEENYDLLHFLNTVMYPHKADFIETVSEYIDFSETEELWKEVSGVTGLGQCVYNDGRMDGIEEGREEGIRVLVLDGIAEQVSRERIIDKLQRYFKLTEEKAEHYYDMFASEI